MAPLRLGNVVRWRNGPSGNIGVVAEHDNGRIRVAFDDATSLIFAPPYEALERVTFAAGAPVRLISDDVSGVVLEMMESDGVVVYQVSMPGEVVKTVVESGIRPAIITDPVALLRRGEIHDARATNLRLTATRLQFAHQFEQLSSLSNSRV